MIDIFLDSDVILDFLTRREPFSLESMELFEFSARGKLRIYISALSLNNIHYVIRKLDSSAKAKKQIGLIMNLVEILPVSKGTIEKAFFSEFIDFEDALQNFCAVENNIDILITRNTKDYSKSSLNVFNPKEFLTRYLPSLI
jgi:predicted nucleic acid-binding protein